MLPEMLLIKWGVLAEVAKGLFQFALLKCFDLNVRLQFYFRDHVFSGLAFNDDNGTRYLGEVRQGNVNDLPLMLAGLFFKISF
jgi:hypothetical protein